MDRPVCKLCGSAHWRYKPHKFGKGKSADADAEGASGGDTVSSGDDREPPQGLRSGKKRVATGGASAINPSRKPEHRDIRDTGAPGAQPITVQPEADEAPTAAPKFDKKAWMRKYMKEHRRGLLRRKRKSFDPLADHRKSKEP